MTERREGGEESPSSLLQEASWREWPLPTKRSACPFPTSHPGPASFPFLPCFFFLFVSVLFLFAPKAANAKEKSLPKRVEVRETEEWRKCSVSSAMQ